MTPGNTLTDYLVKWHGLPYSESTWEKDDYFKQHHADKIEAYEKMKNSDTKPTKNIAKVGSLTVSCIQSLVFTF